MKDEVEKYPIGTTVYYSVEDYDTGKECIYEGKITNIYYKDLELNDTKVHMKLYAIGDGLSMQCNAFYTLEELFQLKERLEYLQQEVVKDKLTKDASEYIRMSDYE